MTGELYALKFGGGANPAFAGGDTGPVGSGGVNPFNADTAAQALANATGQIINLGNATYTPIQMVQQMAEAAKAAATAQAANTSAVIASTSTIQTIADLGISIAQNGDTIISLFSSLPSATQAYLNSVNGTLKSFDETTGTLEYLTSAGETFTTQLTTATAAASALATGTTAAAGSVQILSTAATQVGAVAQAIVNGVVSAFQMPTNLTTSAAPPTFAGLTGIPSAFSFIASSQQYGPGSYGYTDPSLSANATGNPNAQGAATVNVYVTGNSVTSQALVEQLANRVGSAVITNLRTIGGLKL
jgi:hypothetical protein